MRIICAWCAQLISTTCEHCNGVLISARALGGTFGFYGDCMICLNGETPIVYTQRTIEQMKPTHGICPACAELPREIRDALLAERRRQNPRLPSAADLDAIVREQRIKEATDTGRPRPGSSTPSSLRTRASAGWRAWPPRNSSPAAASGP